MGDTPDAPEVQTTVQEGRESEQKAPQRSEFAPITSQEELNRVIGERVAREKAKYAGFDELKAKATEYDHLQEQSKTDLQKALERAEAAEQERDRERLEISRVKAAADAGIPPNLAHRLVGSTPEELAADALELAQVLAPARPRPTTVQSGSTNANAGDWLRNQLARH